MRVIDFWKTQLVYVCGDANRLQNAKNATRVEMQSNISIRKYWWHRDTHLTGSEILRIRKNRANFALAFALCVQNDDVDDALELINNHKGILRQSASSLVQDKFGGDYFQCDDCDHLGHYDDSCSVNDGNRCVCEDCRDNNYHWSDHYDCYVDDDFDEPEYQHIGEYHSSSDNLGRIPSKYDNRKPRVLLGLELEMECSSDYTLDNRAKHLLDNLGDYRDAHGSRYTYALCEQDGSLDSGFEMVTAYTGLDVHKEQLQFFKEPFKGMQSHNTSTCGLHIHICKADMSTLHACKMVFFINDESNQKLVYALARRDASSYAKIHDKKTDKHWLKDAMQAGKGREDNHLQKKYQLRNLNSDRYEALNFRNEKTIEFRLFKGTLKYQTIMACLEFTFATWHFCKDASQTELTTPKFLEFICKAENRSDTRFLRTYLREKGFDLPEKLSKAKPANVKELAISI